MNTEKPHDLVGLEALLAMPNKTREKYVAVTLAEERDLHAKSIEERAEWLEQNKRDPLTVQDIQRIARAEVKRERKAAKRARDKDPIHVGEDWSPMEPNDVGEL